MGKALEPELHLSLDPESLRDQSGFRRCHRREKKGKAYWIDTPLKLASMLPSSCSFSVIQYTDTSMKIFSWPQQVQGHSWANQTRDVLHIAWPPLIFPALWSLA